MNGQVSKSGKNDRLAKRAAALRENLKKRKEQAKARVDDKDDKDGGKSG